MTSYQYIGSAHPFYQYGETYNLVVVVCSLCKRVNVEIPRDKDEELLHSKNLYSGIEMFNKDWVET